MTADMLSDVAHRIFSAHSTPHHVREAEGGLARETWRELQHAGMALVSVPDPAGGDGGDVADAATIIRAAGSHAAAVPVVEACLVGGWLCATAGLIMPRGTVTSAVTDHVSDLTVKSGALTLSRTVTGVPWGADSDHIVLAMPHESETIVAIVPTSSCRVTRRVNLAGEPRDDVELIAVDVPAEHWASTSIGVADAAIRRGALGRALLISGALDSILQLAATHAQSRHQFGRPLGRFQAVEHMVARLAGEVATVDTASTAAVRSMGTVDEELAVAATKVRAAQAAGAASRFAHQVHGAIGVTREHNLQLFSRRLASWRNEYGGERYWGRRLYRLCSTDDTALWDVITGLQSRAGTS